MSTRQTATINGLLTENLGKNDLIRHQEAKARLAESKANDAEREANSLRMETGSLAAEVRYLKKQLEQAKGMQQKAESEAEAYKQLLSRPMQEIAEISGEFKKAYEMQQNMIAQWILAQRAYHETATTLGLQVGKTPEEVQQMASQNANAVLKNETEHGNDASTNPVLAAHAADILALRKQNGKA